MPSPTPTPDPSSQYPMPSAVYGPVKSWRFGNSLGIDMLVVDSICSFNCVYCQLGNIHQVIDEQKVFYPTDRIIADLAEVDPDGVDIVTFSGSGEPTLALNIGEVIDYVRFQMKKPALILTNATWLFDAATRKRIRNASIIDCKLDAATDEMLQKYNRVAPGITMERILRGIRAMRADPDFTGSLTLQCMFMPMNLKEAEQLAALIRDLKPDEVQLNTPRRPHPKDWYQEARGNHEGQAPVDTVKLKTITEEQADEIEKLLIETTGVPIRSIYRRAPK